MRTWEWDLFLLAGTAYEIQREDNAYKTHNAPAQHHPLCGLRRGSSHKPKIRPVSSTVVPLPFQPIAFYLTSSQQSYTVCFFGGLNLTDKCRTLSAGMLWKPMSCQRYMNSWFASLCWKRSLTFWCSFFLLTHQYVIYMKQCIPFWSIHLSFLSAETQSVFASASSWIAAEWYHRLHGGALFLDLDFALDLLEDNLG